MCDLFVTLTDKEIKWILDPRSLIPVNEEPLQPKWRTEIKGYSIKGYSFVDPTGRNRVGETFGSNAHCPMDRKLLTEKSKHIAPGDDSWMARLLRRRLEQGQELPPEWSTWFHGFGRRDSDGVPHEWEELSFHFLEKSTVFSWRDADDVLHVERRPVELWRDATFRPKSTKERGHPKPLRFYDLPFVRRRCSLCSSPEQPADGRRCCECRPWHFQVTEQSNRRFKGPVKNAAKTWAYPLERYEIEGENVPTLINRGCVHVIPHKIDGERINTTRHGTTGWIRSQRKPSLNQETHIRRGKELKNLHSDEKLQTDKDRRLKVKGNTGGWRPLRAEDDFYDWRPHEDQRQAQMRRESGFRTTFDEADSSTEMVWDGDDFTLVDDKPEYFACQIDERGRGRNKTDEELLESREEFEVKRADFEAKLRAGEGWSPLDPREDDRVLPNGVKVNLSNELVKRMDYEIRLHWQDYKTKQSLAEELGLKYETVRRIEMEDINKKKERPTTQFTAEQIRDIAAHDGRVVYVHAVTDRPRWYHLDMERFETYQEAIEAVKRKGKDKALKQSPMWNNERAPKDKFNQALKEVVARWDEYFWKENIFILDLRSPMVVAIAEEAWDEDAA